MCDSCSMTIGALERRGRHHAQRNLLKQTIQTSCRWILIPCTVKVAKEREARVRVKTKVTDPDTTVKAKVYSQSNSDTWMGIAISVVITDTRNQTVTSVEHMGTRRVDCPVKTVAHLESEFTQWNMMVRRWPVSQMLLFGYFWIVDQGVSLFS